jgi:hypothetical protein
LSLNLNLHWSKVVDDCIYCVRRRVPNPVKDLSLFTPVFIVLCPKCFWHFKPWDCITYCENINLINCTYCCLVKKCNRIKPFSRKC